jgi:hypothetical protein
MPIEWTEAMFEMLINLANDEENFTYDVIAVKMSDTFGVNFTKGSVIGKGRRLGIPQRPPKLRKPRKARTLEMGPIPPRIPRAKKGEQVTIYQLREGMCKWPFGSDPPYLYCGCPVKNAGGSWCPEHRKIVHGKVIFDSAIPLRG